MITKDNGNRARETGRVKRGRGVRGPPALTNGVALAENRREVAK